MNDKQQDKRGPGQPRKFTEYTNLCISLDVAQLEQLNAYCEANGLKRSEVVREAISEKIHKGVTDA